MGEWSHETFAHTLAPNLIPKPPSARVFWAETGEYFPANFALFGIFALSFFFLLQDELYFCNPTPLPRLLCSRHRGKVHRGKKKEINGIDVPLTASSNSIPGFVLVF